MQVHHLYVCRHCFGRHYLEPSPDDDKVPLKPPTFTGAWPLCRRHQGQGPECRAFAEQFPTPAMLQEVYKGYFECDGCKAPVIVKFDVQKPAFSPVYPMHHADCGGKLCHVASAPAESFDAYDKSDEWKDIARAVEKRGATQCEADSQRNVRAYLIAAGFWFLSGPSGRDGVALSECCFATFHPTFAIEEMGFMSGAFAQPVRVLLMPRKLRNLFNLDTTCATWPDFVVATYDHKIAYELKTPVGGVKARSDSPLKSPLLSSTFLLDNESVTICKSPVNEKQVGVLCAWLWHYAADIDREAIGRRRHLPADYKNVFLIDLTALGISMLSAMHDLKVLLQRCRRKSAATDPCFVYSEKWWTLHWQGIHFFWHGQIHDSGLLTVLDVKTKSYDDLVLNLLANDWYVQRCAEAVPSSEPEPASDHSDIAICRTCKTQAKRGMFNWCTVCDDETAFCKTCSEPSPLSMLNAAYDCVDCAGTRIEAHRSCGFCGARTLKTPQQRELGLCNACIPKLFPLPKQ